MSNSFTSKKLNFIINFVYIFLILLVSYAFLKYALPVAFPIVLSIFIAYIAEPTVNVISSQTKIKRSICSFITILFIIVLIFGIVSVLAVTFFSNLELITNKLPLIINKINDFFTDTIAKHDKTFIEKAVAYGYSFFKRYNFENSGIVTDLINYLTSIIKSVPSFVFNLFITLILSVFISSSFLEIKKFIKNKFSKNYQDLFIGIKNCSISLLKNYLKSYFVIMLITFCELTVAFFIFKIKPAITLAFIISLVDILPVFGVGTIMIPWGVILMLCGNFSKGVLIIAIYIFITTIRQIIEPKIVSQSIGLPSVITLPLMFLGIKLFGVIGIFLLPMIVTIFYDLYKKGCFNFLLTKQFKKYNIEYTE